MSFSIQLYTGQRSILVWSTKISIPWWNGSSFDCFIDTCNSEGRLLSSSAMSAKLSCVGGSYPQPRKSKGNRPPISAWKHAFQQWGNYRKLCTGLHTPLSLGPLWSYPYVAILTPEMCPGNRILSDDSTRPTNMLILSFFQALIGQWWVKTT